MSNITWRVAEAVVDPRRAFALELLEKGLCRSPDDFARLFGRPEVFRRVLADLEADGLVASDRRLSLAGGRLWPTPQGTEALRMVAELGAADDETGTAGTASSAD